MGTDGSPTDIYKRYRNEGESGRAVADAIRIGYAALYRINEKAHELGDEQLQGLILQVTGGKKDDSTTKFILNCFKILKAHARFHDAMLVEAAKDSTPEPPSPRAGKKPPPSDHERNVGMNLSYTINLNLPASTDVAVFNAIFQSLRKNLLRDE